MHWYTPVLKCLDLEVRESLQKFLKWPFTVELDHLTAVMKVWLGDLLAESVWVEIFPAYHSYIHPCKISLSSVNDIGLRRGRKKRNGEREGKGKAIFSNIQHFLLAEGLSGGLHFNQSLLLLVQELIYFFYMSSIL